MKIVLIRHTSLDIPKGICYGQSDIKVSDKFTEEATLVKTQLEKYNFDAVYTSPLSRCAQLASFSGYPYAIHEPRLMELNFGDWEMQNWDEIQDATLSDWYKDWVNIPATNGESFMDQYERYASFIDELSTQQYNIVAAFTHGGILHCARIHAGVDTFANTFDHPLRYGEILEMSI